MALKVASTHLGPLAASNQALLKPLKETLLALLNPDEAALTKGFPLSALSTSLQVAFLCFKTFLSSMYVIFLLIVSLLTFLQLN